MRRYSSGRGAMAVLGALAIALTMTLTACGGGGEASGETTKLTMASYQPPGSPWATAYNQWAEQVKEQTEGRVEIEIFDQESLLPQAEIMPGVGSGQADIGFFVESYHPAELPLSTVTELPFVSEDAQAQVETFNELYETYAPLKEEYDAQNIQIASFMPAPAAVISTTKPLAGPDDLEGLQVRASGYLAEAIKRAGAKPQSLTVGEVYEALERGVLDANVTVLEITKDLGLQDIAPYVTSMGTGDYAIAAIGFNKDKWAQISAEDQSTIRELATESSGVALKEFAKAGEEACQAMWDSGGDVQVWDEAAIAEWKQQVYDDLEREWIDTASSNGAPAKEFLQRYLDLLEKKEADSTFESSIRGCEQES